MKWRRLVMGVLCAGVIGGAALLAMQQTERGVPGLRERERTLLRIWVTNAPGGAVKWLKAQLRTFEQEHPGVSTYLRTVEAGELSDPQALLPDVVLYMPGDVQTPEGVFLPLTGADGLLREELLRCGRWRERQYGLPLCWGAWLLAIDGKLEPGSASTPAPTTLLGRPAATSAAATQTPGYPLQAAAREECALQSPGGAALFTLALLMEEYPPLPEDFAALSSADVYAAFRAGRCATAMLTTGQEMALTAQPHRVMAAQEIITDQVWLGSITRNAPREAALLLGQLTSPEAQRALYDQGLHTVRNDLTLYTSAAAALVESAGKRALTAINAYLPQDEVRGAAWRYFQRQSTLDEALLPLR